MAQVLAHPLRVVGSSLATVEQDSDPGVAQAIALLVTTRRGERELAPGWGVTDPAFEGLSTAEVNAGLALYGPDGVEVTAVDVDVPDSTTERVTLAFTRSS